MKDKCTLPNEELIQRCEEWVHSLAKSGGDTWVLQVPVNFNKDPDMLFIELINRFRVTMNPPTDIEKIRDEAKGLYPTWPFCEKSQERFKNQELQRAHISCAEQYSQRLAEMGQLLMDKDGQIESLENRVKELEGKLSTAKAIIQQQGGIISKHHL